MVNGYLNRRYAESFMGFGTPKELPRCGGWILERKIPGFSYHDGMGCYPIFACRDWSQLCIDMEDIGDELVCLALVTDPFGEYNETLLNRSFADRVIPFKQHFVTDLGCPIDTIVSKHHRRYAKKALKKVCIEKCEDPNQFVDEWSDLYKVLIQRHNIKGIVEFSRRSFVKQLNVPGIVAFRAEYENRVVGMILWYVQGDVGYYHLGASTPKGYEMRASFGLFWFAIEYFATLGLRCLDLGAGAGVRSNSTDGLNRFKRGWSTGTKTAYFCGHIFDRAGYSEVMRVKDITVNDYFPAYRKDEFK
jgi:hypothetical protein